MTRRAAILGLGERGLTWARAAHTAGWVLRGFDPDPLAGTALGVLGDWRRETTISATLARADWVFCCLPDRLELVQAMVQRAQAGAPEDAVIAVASESFDIETLQTPMIRPGQVVRLSLGPNRGGLAVDLTDRNPGTVRSAVHAGMAELAAVLSLAPPAAGGETVQPGDAESA